MKINTTHLTPKQILKTNYNHYKDLYPSLKDAGEDDEDFYDIECDLLNEMVDAIIPNIGVEADTQAGIGPITIQINGEWDDMEYYQYEASEEEKHFNDSLSTSTNFNDFIIKLSNFYYNILNDPKYHHQGEWSDYTKRH